MKRNLTVLTLLCLLTACGGGGGGSSNNGGGNNGGGNNGGGNNGGGNNGGSDDVVLPGSKNTGSGDNILYLTNHDNMHYMGVFHGKRSATSSFTSIDKDTSAITPTNTDGYLSLAIQCSVRSGGPEITIYDLKINGSRELDLKCYAQTPGGLSRTTLKATSTSNYTMHSAAFMGSNIANASVPDPIIHDINKYNDPLRSFQSKFNDYDDRTIWGLYYSTDSAILSVYEKSIFGDLRKSESNPINYLEPFITYELPYDPNHDKNIDLDLLETPESKFYSLDYFSPDRFINPLRTSRKTDTDASLAALIPSELKSNNDYYVEHFISEKSYVYRHISTNPQGAALFGDNGTYKGDAELGNLNFKISATGAVSYNEPNSIEDSLDLIGREVSIIYATGVGGQRMDINYYSELEDDFVLSNEFEDTFGTTDLSQSMSSLFPHYEGIAFNNGKVFSYKLRFFYSNGIAGNGNVTMYTIQY